MFRIFKRQARQELPSGVGEKLLQVENLLRQMGYELNPYGAAVAAAELVSSYQPADVASHIALTTLARDVREADLDIDKLTRLAVHGDAVLRILKQLRDSGMMHPAQWQNDASAIAGICYVGPEQTEWVETVLSDPVAGKERLAKSRIE